MNTAVTFDTHEFVKSLEAAGMPVQQAEAISSAVRKAQDGADVARRDEMATKGDIAAVKSELRELETRLVAKIDTLKWMLGFVIAVMLLPLIKALF